MIYSQNEIKIHIKLLNILKKDKLFNLKQIFQVFENVFVNVFQNVVSM